MLISVIIPTRNRVDKLARCLESFDQIRTNHDWELIIVDNGSKDQTANYLQSVKRNNFKWLYEPKHGGTCARNAGYKSSLGDIVAFTDDDCYVTENYIEALAEAFQKETVGFIGGRVLLYDKNDIPMTIKESSRYETFPPHSFLPAGAVHGACMAFRREALDAIGGFDEAFAGISGADIVACADALWLGIPGAYDPNVVVYHHHGRQTKIEARNLWRFYDFGRGAYQAKFILNSNSRACYLRGWAKHYRQFGGFRDSIVALRRLVREMRGFFYFCWAHKRT